MKKQNSVEFFTKYYCPFCRRAKTILDGKGIKFNEVRLDLDPKKEKDIKRKYQWNTVPIIVVNGVCVGGCDELEALIRSGKFDRTFFVDASSSNLEKADT